MTDGLFTDTLRWWRSWTWRTLLESLCARGLEIATRAPAEPKLRIRIREEWESRGPVEAYRDKRHIVIFAGGRFLRFKR